MIIRRAVVGEHVALMELALRSVQRGWGYSDEFMAWEPEAITVSPSHISDAITNVLEQDGRIVGFYVLTRPSHHESRITNHVPVEMELSRMMVEPYAIGTGCGRRMWEHAVETARDLGVTIITLDADPNAEPFYVRMGAETIGEHDWEPPMMPGWRVKKMRFAL